jgi:hypothetical protein
VAVLAVQPTVAVGLVFAPFAHGVFLLVADGDGLLATVLAAQRAIEADLLASRLARRVSELNRIVARLSKFSGAEMRKARRRIHTERGPVGDTSPDCSSEAAMRKLAGLLFLLSALWTVIATAQVREEFSVPVDYKGGQIQLR